MSNREFTATRTMLANAFATAGAELLEYMGVGAALAAIPNTEPPKYVVAGTLQMIAKMLPGLESTAVSPDPAAAGTRRPTIRAAIEKALEGRHIEDGTVDAFNDVIDAIEREVLAAHAGVTAEPAGRGQTDETDISARLRQRAAGAMANQDDAKLMLTAADECNRFYNGMMNWKANAQAKDRTIIELRETSKAAQVPAAEVRAQALGDAIEEVAKVGALWIDNSNRDTAAPILSQAIAAIRSLAHQSTADSANTDALGEKGAEA